MDKKKLLIIACSMITVITSIIIVLLINNNKTMTYDITFETNGGSLVESQIVNEGDQVKKPVDPTKDGYIFVEWTYQGRTYDFSLGVTSHLTLIARWVEEKEDVETFIVKFETDGGTTISNQVVEKGNKVTKPTDPVRDGYIFEGWFLKDEIYNFDKALKEDIELQAKWEQEKEPNNNTTNDGNSSSNNNTTKPTTPTKPTPTVKKYTVTFDSNGGSSVSSQTVNEGEKASQPSNPSRSGYKFVGWNLNGNVYNFNSAVKENITLVANWALLGDTNADGKVALKDVTDLHGYIYGLGTKINLVNSDVNVDGEIDDVDLAILNKYVADWNIKLPYNSGAKYTINYNFNGGTIKDANYKKYAQISLPYTLKNPTKEGYQFIGWTGSNGNTPELEVIIKEGTTGNLEYTANWALLGDTNADEKIDLKDVTNLDNYLNRSGTEINLANSDVNMDGEIDDVDLAILFKYVSDWNIKLPYNSGAKYTINYNLNGGTIENTNYKKYAQISLPYKLKNPTKEGYTFLGWTGSNGNTAELEVIIEAGTTGNLEYIANWQLNS